MIYRKLTDAGDYSFGSSEQNFLSGIEAIQQAIKTKLLLFYSEWWEDISIGMPMFQSIIGQVNTQNISIALKEMVIQRLADIPQITEVKDVEVTINGRDIHLSLKAIIQDEEVEVEINNV